jgi:hypothetical protein
MNKLFTKENVIPTIFRTAISAHTTKLTYITQGARQDISVDRMCKCANKIPTKMNRKLTSSNLIFCCFLMVVN